MTRKIITLIIFITLIFTGCSSISKDKKTSTVVNEVVENEVSKPQEEIDKEETIDKSIEENTQEAEEQQIDAGNEEKSENKNIMEETEDKSITEVPDSADKTEIKNRDTSEEKMEKKEENIFEYEEIIENDKQNIETRDVGEEKDNLKKLENTEKDIPIIDEKNILQEEENEEKSEQNIETINAEEKKEFIINKKEIKLVEGQEYKIDGITLIGFDNDKISWETTDDSIVSVAEEGKLHAKKPGKALITGIIGGVKQDIDVEVDIDYEPVKIKISTEKDRIFADGEDFTEFSYEAWNNVGRQISIENPKYFKDEEEVDGNRVITHKPQTFEVYLKHGEVKSNTLMITGYGEIIRFSDRKFLNFFKNYFDRRRNIYKEDTVDIIELDIKKDNIDSINGLEHFSNLEKLIVSGTRLKSIKILEKLKKLRHLDISLTNLDKIQEVSRFNDLISFDLSGVNISDTTLLRNSTKLEELALNYTDITDLKGLSKLNSLRVLELSNTDVEDISILKNMPHLQRIDLDKTKVKNIDVLKDLKELEQVDLYNTDSLNKSEGSKAYTVIEELIKRGVRVNY